MSKNKKSDLGIAIEKISSQRIRENKKYQSKVLSNHLDDYIEGTLNDSYVPKVLQKTPKTNLFINYPQTDLSIEQNNIKIPRPILENYESIDKLKQHQSQEFTKWRNLMNLNMQKFQDKLSPFERRLNIWKQLWRCVQSSQILLLIFDIRSPLLYRCSDLEQYIKENNKPVNYNAMLFSFL